MFSSFLLWSLTISLLTYLYFLSHTTYLSVSVLHHSALDANQPISIYITCSPLMTLRNVLAHKTHTSPLPPFCHVIGVIWHGATQAQRQEDVRRSGDGRNSN